MEAFRTKLVQLLEAEENPQENTYALTMVDVNNFSYVNENFGAEMGDSILKEFSRLLERKSNGSMPYVLGLFPCIVQGKEPAGDPEAR